MLREETPQGTFHCVLWGNTHWPSPYLLSAVVWSHVFLSVHLYYTLKTSLFSVLAGWETYSTQLQVFHVLMTLTLSLPISDHQELTAHTSGLLAMPMDHYCRVGLGEERIATSLLPRILPRKTGRGVDTILVPIIVLSFAAYIILGELFNFVIAFAYLWSRVLLMWVTS